MFIRSERLFLRPGWPEDWREIMTQVADEAIVRHLDAVPWPYTSDHAREFAALPQDPRCPHFLATLPGANGADVIGCVGLKPGEHGVELGYWFGRAHWGRGYATEAARAVLRLAQILGHRRIFASHFTDNPASGRVLRKLGFCPTGTERMSYSHARGEMAPSAVLALAFDAPNDCDDDGPREPAMMRQRAA
jgi:RimJ/RimL family protein N-acetyltransferase